MSKSGSQTALVTVSVIFFLLLLVSAFICHLWRVGHLVLVETWTTTLASGTWDMTKRSSRVGGVEHLTMRRPSGGTLDVTCPVNPTNSWWPQAGTFNFSIAGEPKKTNYHWALDMEKVKLGGPEKITCSGRGASVE